MSAISGLDKLMNKSTEHTRKIGAIFSGADSGGGSGAGEVGSAHKVEPAGKDSFHMSDEAMGKE